ncbi:kinase-like domain-containing protein [Xylariaceae sp. FL0594]|nr:kinase-like domain-containing protein [Xylariaceae sp. FL0594]
MDSDPDKENVIAYLYPVIGSKGCGSTVAAIEDDKGSLLYRSPKKVRPKPVETPQQQAGETLARDQREQTLERKKVGNPRDYLPFIQVTFDYIPKTRYGLRIGRGKDADLCFPQAGGVSNYHLALTFNTDYRLIVRDLGSRQGNIVSMSKRFDLFIGEQLHFQLIVPKHDIGSKSFRDRVNRFWAGTTDAEQVLDLSRLGPLSPVETKPLPGTQPQPPDAVRNTILRKFVGEGAFAKVTHVWDFSTGKQYALKEPKEGPMTRFDLWRREIEIMRKSSMLKHIVQLLDYSFPPSPWLHLEYVPVKTLRTEANSYTALSYREQWQIFLQSSDALAYLHSQNPPIIHRDIKPANILVQHRRPGDIYIKFADFGGSREGDDLTSFTGTCIYMAPDVYRARANRLGKNKLEAGKEPGEMSYTGLVDVWSLGVLLAELVCCLLNGEEYARSGDENDCGGGEEWCEILRDWVKDFLPPPEEGQPEDTEDILLFFVLNSMLTLDPKDRKTAQECYDYALTVPLDSLSRYTAPREAAGRHQSFIGASTIRPGKANGTSDGPPTVIPAGVAIEAKEGRPSKTPGATGSVVSVKRPRAAK